MTRSKYEIFMEEYRECHKYCPNCGSDKYGTTLMAFVLDLNNTEQYEDRNHAYCSCGFKHTIHDRLPNPPSVA